jgi:hypothetical protein
MSTTEQIIGIGAVIVICIVFLVAMIIIINRIKHKNHPYYTDPKHKPFSKEEQKAILVGAILSKVNEEPLDRLVPFKPSKIKEQMESLEEWWGIIHRVDALRTLNWLRNGGHSNEMQPFLLKFLEHLNANTLEDYYNKSLSAPKEQVDDALYISNLLDAAEKLQEYGYIKNADEDLSKINLIAWDLGRLVNVARWCYGCGYIKENEAWDYINYAKDECLKHYENWAAFSKAYIIGRAIWGGDDGSLDYNIDIVAELLEDQKSPWNLTQLN